ncbi:MAG TPA: hypothetical protein VIV40_20115 [Kofleriaceae bacterium]
MKLMCAVALVGGCVDTQESTGAEEQQLGPAPVFHQTWNAGAASGNAYDPSTGASGQVYAFANGNGAMRQAFMSFYYQGPDPTSVVCMTWPDPFWMEWTFCYPTRYITKWGWGPIPSVDFTVDPRATAARLHTTTGAGYFTETCVSEWSPWGYGNCTFGEPATFDLAWQPDGFGSFSHSGTFQQTFGGHGMRQSGTFTSRSARVNGSALGFTIANAFGGIDDSKGATITHDIVNVMP